MISILEQAEATGKPVPDLCCKHGINRLSRCKVFFDLN